MSFSVAVLDEIGYEHLSDERATSLCAAAFMSQGFDLEKLGEVSVVLVDTDVIRNLNVKFRDRNEPTDVLSFDIDGPHGEMVGEIVICPAQCAPELGVEELVVHGALHLAGLDHGEDFEESEMSRVQWRVLEAMSGS